MTNISILDAINTSRVHQCRGATVHTDEGEIIHVEASSLEDYARGKKLFEKFSEQVSRVGGAKYGQLISMGVIEGGADDGPSCMFLVLSPSKDGTPDQFFVFETTASSLSALVSAVGKCQQYFNRNQTENA